MKTNMESTLREHVSELHSSNCDVCGLVANSPITLKEHLCEGHLKRGAKRNRIETSLIFDKILHNTSKTIQIPENCKESL